MISGIIPQQQWNQRNENAMLTQKEATSPADEELQTYKEGIRRQREGNIYNSVYHKMMGGQRLSLSEEDTLRQRDLKVYMEYKADVEEEKAYEERLRQCKSKEEAQKMHMNKVHSNLNALRKIINDPCISKEKKVKEVQRIQGATSVSIRSFHEFADGDVYGKLPEEQEIRRLESDMDRDVEMTKEDFVLSGYREEEKKTVPGLALVYEKEESTMQEIRKIHSKEAGIAKGLEVDVLV
ncbi:hypothetical protein SAMN02910358_02291 [Lachnospiraceae bacterium XBB1006]|nr:hypothetical protein SAMN02910358_02291 [Lachnospiraceae bacterium XBB1006]